ncbi:hypothetical protein NARC_70038 [Candidatus Nitrosocosmicus arcticus]|uniref:Uncharacterized protein n=1 Tax=Candidatus Nitrosocosmicus arcticus TaxID=2035267 RepID=A0A557SV28_9ARCH|nr:hypothetical protein NARC_70038 [Candidatus Nitrosocosmicus arcticus]
MKILSDVTLQTVKYRQIKKELTVPYLQKQNLCIEFNLGLIIYVQVLVSN